MSILLVLDRSTELNFRKPDVCRIMLRNSNQWLKRAHLITLSNQCPAVFGESLVGDYSRDTGIILTSESTHCVQCPCGFEGKLVAMSKRTSAGFTCQPVGGDSLSDVILCPADTSARYNNLVNQFKVFSAFKFPECRPNFIPHFHRFRIS